MQRNCRINWHKVSLGLAEGERKAKQERGGGAHRLKDLEITTTKKTSTVVFTPKYLHVARIVFPGASPAFAKACIEEIVHVPLNRLPHELFEEATVISVPSPALF